MAWISFIIALATWSVQDPSLSYATSRAIHNVLGYPGAIGADLLMQILGLGAIMLILPVAIWGWRMLTHRPFDREAMRLAHEHLDYIDWLIDTRRWLAGAQMSLADFAAAAQISVADYLGGIDWTGHEEAHGWYRVMKSRPSFRPLLTEKMEGIPVPAGYSDPNS